MTKLGISKLALALVLATGGATYGHAADANKGGDHMMMDQGEMMSPDRMIEHMDADKNGTISESEFVNGAKQHFTKMDTNGDGQLTREEIQACMQTYCGGMMGGGQGGGQKHSRGHSSGGGMGMGGMVTTHPMQGE